MYRRNGANMDFVLFKADKTNQDDKNIETNFIFAHQVLITYILVLGLHHQVKNGLQFQFVFKMINDQSENCQVGHNIGLYHDGPCPDPNDPDPFCK